METQVNLSNFTSAFTRGVSSVKSCGFTSPLYLQLLPCRHRRAMITDRNGSLSLEKLVAWEMEAMELSPRIQVWTHLSSEQPESEKCPENM